MRLILWRARRVLAFQPFFPIAQHIPLFPLRSLTPPRTLLQCRALRFLRSFPRRNHERLTFGMRIYG